MKRCAQWDCSLHDAVSSVNTNGASLMFRQPVTWQPNNSVQVNKVRSFATSDDILCARVTPDGRLLALALLNSTVQASGRHVRL